MAKTVKTIKKIKKVLKKHAKPAKYAAHPGQVIGGEAHAETAAAPPALSGAILDQLFEVVTSRRDADPAVSHSARLLARGSAKVAQKFGEEAVECVIEAVSGNRAALISESADVLYHLIVLWVSVGVRAEEVWAELKRRKGTSGIVEKAMRAASFPASESGEMKKLP